MSITAPTTATTYAGSDRFYFPQIDGLRCLAFVLVLLHHFHARTEFLTPGTVSHKAAFFFQQIGWAGVDIFLVLSSFLIFSLLIREKDKTGTLSIRRFYIRRALRIWPLYFPYVIFAMVILPLFWNIQTPEQYSTTQKEHLFPFMTFLGNFSYAYFPGSRTAFFGHMWTICLEEQFYIFPPLIVFFFALRPNFRVFGVILGLFLFTMAVKAYFIHTGVPYPMIWVNPLSRLDPFLIGAVCAILYKHHRAIFSPRFGWIYGLAGAGLIALGGGYGIMGTSYHTIWQLFAVALGAGLLIMGVLSSPAWARVFGFGIIPYLGKISFGLYVYHEISLNLVFQFLTVKPYLGTGPLAWGLDLCITFAITALIAALSYRLYESRFLRLKDKFAPVLSRPV